MRAELKEKQGLLCEAAAALELMEQSQKKAQDDSLATAEQLNQKIQFLEVGWRECPDEFNLIFKFVLFVSDGN